MSEITKTETAPVQEKKAGSGDYIVMLKEAGALLAITLVAGLLLGFVYELTKKPREYQKELAIQKACSEVMPGAENYKELDYTLSAELSEELAGTGVTIGTVYEAYGTGGSFEGYVIESTSSEGYGGDIVLYLGVRPSEEENLLTGVSILSISETAGLGMRAEEVLVPQFADKNVSSFVYTKQGATHDNEIDAISGATITTKAVTNAVNGGLNAADYLFENEREGR